jgi:uncharacterized protein
MWDKGLASLVLALSAVAVLAAGSARRAQPNAAQTAIGDCAALRDSCDAGQLEACVDVGDSLLLGGPRCTPSRTDARLATTYYGKACDEGYARGCLNLGAVLSTEVYGLSDPGRAGQAYWKAEPILRRDCERGDPDACSILAGLIEAGSVTGQGSEAATYFQRAVDLLGTECKRGSGEACARLADQYASTQPERWRDPSKRRAALLEACERGHAISCCKAGEALREGAAPESAHVSRAVELFDRACALGMHSCCTLAGEHHERGLGVPSDLKRAAGSYEQACRGGSCLSCRRVADMYEKGLGVQKDGRRATELRALPCNEGQ